MADYGFTIAEWVRRYRRGANLTQAELAEDTGLSQSYIAKIEGGDAQNIDRAKILSIGRAVHLSSFGINEALELLGLAPMRQDEIDAVFGVSQSKSAQRQIRRLGDPDRELLLEAYDGADHRERRLMLDVARLVRTAERDTAIGGHVATDDTEEGSSDGDGTSAESVPGGRRRTP